MKCGANKTGCVAYNNGECHTIENCMHQVEDNDDVEIWDDEFEDEDMEMSPEELEEDEYETKLEYLYRKYDCNDMETLQTRCPKPHKVNNRYKRKYSENIKSSDHITDSDDSYEDEEYERV